MTCTDCGTSTDKSYGLCLGCNIARGVAERAAQGLPSKIEDPGVLARVAQIITAPGVEAAS